MNKCFLIANYARKIEKLMCGYMIKGNLWFINFIIWWLPLLLLA